MKSRSQEGQFDICLALFDISNGNIQCSNLLSPSPLVILQFDNTPIVMRVILLSK